MGQGWNRCFPHSSIGEESACNAGEKGKWSRSVDVRLFVTTWTVVYQAPPSMDFPGKSAGVDCHFFLQGIFPTQGLNLGLLHCRKMFYPLSHQGSNAGDPSSIPGSGRSPREGIGYPLQYSGLENSMDCVFHGVVKSRTWLSDFHFQNRWRGIRGWKLLRIKWVNYKDVMYRTRNMANIL